MKFSELSTDRAADVLCEVSVYALNILTDDELRESLKAQIDAEKPQTAGEKYAIGAQKIGQWIPLILKKHREDTLGILAAVNETTVETVKKQSVLKPCGRFRRSLRTRICWIFSNRARRRRKRNACASGSSKDKRGRADSPFADFGKAAAGGISLPHLYDGVFAHNDGKHSEIRGRQLCSGEIFRPDRPEAAGQPNLRRNHRRGC